MDLFRQVKIEGMGKTAFPDDQYVLLLQEIEGEGRKLPIMLNEKEANLAMLTFASKDGAFELSMHHVLLDFIWKVEGKLSRAEIFRIENSEFKTRVWIKKGNEEVFLPMHTTNAIALALLSNAPVYVLDAILNSEHMRDLGNGQYSLPASLVGLEMLEEALKDAIKKEKYELASQLRDEIRKRKEKKK